MNVFAEQEQRCRRREQTCRHRQGEERGTNWERGIDNIQCVRAASLLSRLCNPVDWRLPGSSVHEFSRQEYQSELPFPPPGYLPNPGSEAASLMFLALIGGFFTTSTTSESHIPVPCVKQIASGNLLYSTGGSTECSEMTQRGGREAHAGGDTCVCITDLLCYTQQKPTQHCKTIIFQ